MRLWWGCVQAHLLLVTSVQCVSARVVFLLAMTPPRLLLWRRWVDHHKPPGDTAAKEWLCLLSPCVERWVRVTTAPVCAASIGHARLWVTHALVMRRAARKKKPKSTNAKKKAKKSKKKKTTR